MREIKFRAWNSVSNGFKTNEQTLELMLNGNSPKYKIMQYTGIKDKNGVDIYEGDIIKGGYYKSYEVRWDFGNSSWNINYHIQNTWEILGNIYENPELLK